MGSGNVEIRLRHDAHAEVVERAGPKAGEGRDEGDGPIAAGETDADPSHVLLTDEALYVALGILLAHFLRERGVLHVSVQRNNPLVVVDDLDQSAAVRLASGQGVAHLVVRRRREANVGNVHRGCIHCGSLRDGILNIGGAHEGLEMFNDLL